MYLYRGPPLPPWMPLAVLPADLCRELMEEAAEAFKVPLCDESIHMRITVLLSQPLYTVGNKMLL